MPRLPCRARYSLEDSQFFFRDDPAPTNALTQATFKAKLPNAAFADAESFRSFFDCEETEISHFFHTPFSNVVDSLSQVD